MNLYSRVLKWVKDLFVMVQEYQLRSPVTAYFEYLDGGRHVSKIDRVEHSLQIPEINVGWHSNESLPDQPQLRIFKLIHTSVDGSGYFAHYKEQS